MNVATVALRSHIKRLRARITDEEEMLRQAQDRVAGAEEFIAAATSQISEIEAAIMKLET